MLLISQELIDKITAIQLRASRKEFEEVRLGIKPNKSKGEEFLRSPEWVSLRKLAFKIYGRKCMRCGSTKHPCADHVKSRRHHPELALELSNLQILCWDCNSEKGCRHNTDYRDTTHSDGIAILKELKHSSLMM